MNLIQVCSDIHLEYGGITRDDFNKVIIPSAEILVLAGDIGNPFEDIYEEFIDYCSKLFIHVLVIAGNHEYYNNNYYLVSNKIESICNKYNNIHYLDNKTFEYEGIIFIGTILWSYIPNHITIYNLHAMNDFKKIGNMTLELYKQLFEINLNFLEETLEKYKNQECIILTHHSPSYNCLLKDFVTDKLDCCFASDLDYLFQKYKNLLGWIYGHVHYNYKEYNEKYFIYSNCYRTIDYNNKGCPL